MWSTVANALGKLEFDSDVCKFEMGIIVMGYYMLESKQVAQYFSGSWLCKKCLDGGVKSR